MFIQKVIKAFEANNIKHALAGGYAVSLHGAVRGTVDIDILVHLDEKNLLKVENTLLSIGLTSKIPVGASEVAKFRNDFIKNKGMKAWSFINPDLPVEIVDIIILYDLNEFDITKIRSVFGTINVVSLEGLIRMKREAARPQDLSDVEALQKIKGDSLRC